MMPYPHVTQATAANNGVTTITGAACHSFDSYAPLNKDED